MAPETKRYIANGTMFVGLLPWIAVLIYAALTSSDKGDAALAAVFTIILGLGVAYVAALAIAFPAFLWSRSLVKSLGTDTRCSIVLRRAVICSVLPLFAIFPFLAFAVLR
jgi:hypothetical protein